MSAKAVPNVAYTLPLNVWIMSGPIHKASTGRPAEKPGERLLKGLTLAVCLLAGLLFPAVAHAQPGSGTAVIFPPADVTAGFSGTWTITYTATADFSTGVVRLVIPAEWTLPQESSNSSAGYVTAVSEGTLNVADPVSIVGRNITINVDTLTAGETIDIVYGDSSSSVLGKAESQTVAGSGVEFLVQSNPLGASPASIVSSPKLNVVAAPASKLVFLTAERTVKADGESLVMRVQAQDEFDNPAPVGSDQDLSLATTSGAGIFSHLSNGSWSATTTVTVSAGEDTASFYYRDTVPGIYDITVSADGQSWTDAQQQVTVEPGDPTALAVSPQDTTITAGEFARYIIRSVDIHGNPSAPSSDQTISLLAGAGNFYDKDNHSSSVTSLVIPSGSTSAEVDYWYNAMNMAAGYFLVFLDNDAVPPLLESDNTVVYINHAAIDTSTSYITVDAATADADGVDEIGVTVRIVDQYYNSIDGVTVVLEVDGTGNTITQPSGVTGPGGIATGSVRSTGAGAKNIRATADGVHLEDIIPVTFQPGPVDLAVSTIDAVPDTVVANGSDVTTVTVTARDQYGNAVQGAAVVLGATGSGNTIVQPGVVTDAAGVATGTVASSVAETKTISATINGSPLTPTVSVVFRTGSFSQALSEISGDKAQVTADDVELLTVTVTVRDGAGNPVSGSSVTLEATGTGNTIVQPVGVTGADGMATGTVRSTVAELKTVSARVDGFLLNDTLDVQWRAGAVDLAVSTIDAVPDTVVANGSDVTTVTVTARDQYGNAVQGAAVVLGATGSGNTIVQPGVVTDAAGVATGTVASSVAETKTISATINGSPLTPTVSVVFRTGSFSQALSEISGDKAQVTADDVELLTVTVTVRDGAGNPVSGSSVTLEATGTGNTIVQPVGVTGADGMATGTVRSTVAELKTVSARVDGFLLNDTLDVQWIPGPIDPDHSLIVSDVGTVTADGSDNCRITVVVLDANNNPISGASVILHATDTDGGNTIFQPSVPTAENGVAVGWISSTKAEVKTVSAEINGSMTNNTVDVAFIAGPPDRFLIAHDGSGVADVPENISIQIIDVNDNTVDWFDDVIILYTDSQESTDMISWGLGGGSSGSIVSEAGDTVYYDFAPADNGTVTLLFRDKRAETIRVTARYGSVVDQSAQSMAVGPASADSIFVIAGDGQRAVVGQAVPQQLTVGVEDAFGNRVPAEPVRFQVIDGGGTIDTDLLTPLDQEWVDTDGSGTAICGSWILGTVSGEDSDRARASISFGSTSAVIFTATADHDELASVVLTPGSGSVTVNSATIVTATMEDQYGNLVVGENLTIFIKDAADGTLSEDPGNPNPTITLGPGIRSGSSDSTGTVTVQYNSPAAAGLQDIIDASHAVLTAAQIDDVVYTSVASGATKLIVTGLAGLPSQAGVPFSFTVRAVDSNDNLDPTDTSHIVLVPEAGGGLTFSATPGFPSTITEADLAGGEIVLYGMGTRNGDWDIDVTTTGLSPTQFTAAITANDTVHHYVITAPPSVVAGADFTASLAARDEWNNLVRTAQYDIDLRAVQAVDTTAAASGVLTITSGAISGGRFTEDNLRYYLAEPIRVEISDDSTSVVGVSEIINVNHAPAWQITEVSGDTTGVAAGDSVLLTMRVADSFGNHVSGEMVTFSILQGGGGLAALQRVTAANGITSVSYATGAVAGTNRVRAAILDGNPEGLETREFVIETVPRGSIDHVTLIIDGSTFEAGEAFTGHVAAFDEHGNLVVSDNTKRLIPVAESASIDFMPDTLQLTAGAATFTATDTVMGTNRIRIEDLVGSTLAPFGNLLTITAGPAYELVKVSGDTTGVISGDTTEVIVRVADMYGNPVQDETVRFLITSSLGGTPRLIDQTGAPYDGLVLSSTGGTAACSLVTDTNFGTNTILATILDGSPTRETGTFNIVTSAGAISRYTVVPAGMVHTAGDVFEVTITAYDLNDNIAYGDDSTVVDLGSDGTALWVENPVTLVNGQYSVSVSETTSGPLVLSAQTQGGTALSYSGTITILPDLPSGTIPIVSIGADTITSNGSSLSSITAGPVTDMYNNRVPQRTRITVSTTAGSIASEDLDLVTPGVQRETGPNSFVSAFVRSGTTPVDADIVFESVEGTAYGDTTITFAPVPAVAYDDSIYPVYAVPGLGERFSVRVRNDSQTGVILNTSSTFSFSDGQGNTFMAPLASSKSFAGGTTDSLLFVDTAVPVSFEPGTYSPRISLSGMDVYGSPYSAQFEAGINSVIVSSIEITDIQVHDPLVSRGDTVYVDVRVMNKGGAPVRVYDINLSFAMGSYTVLDDVVPALPDTLDGDSEEIYTLGVHVLPGCPLGPDTIDAWVQAHVNGNDISDQSADENFATWTVQSAADITYQAGTLSPQTVSRGQVHSFTFDLRNNGQAAVILDGALTRLSFTDGALTYMVSLGEEGALPGSTISDLVFPAAAIPAAMAPGAWQVTLDLVGTENGGAFITTLILSDPVTVVDPASVAYTPATLAPAVVSKNSSVAFEVGITNSGGADVILDPAATTFELDDGTTSYTAYLDGTRNILLGPGDNTIWFHAVTVSGAFLSGAHVPVIRISGTENGIPFTAQPPVGDSVTIQDASQLSITNTSIMPTDLFTADQIGERVAGIRVANNGEAVVRLDSLDLRLFLGRTDVTGQYTLAEGIPVSGIEVPGGTDTLVLMMISDAAGPMSTGTVTVESSIWGTDLNSTEELEATTEYGGKGSFTVQTPAVLEVTRVLASVDEATSGQGRDWTVDVIVSNSGESDLDLDLASTGLTFSTSTDFTVIPPAEFVGGGVTLEGESSDTLRFIVDVTGSAAGACSVNAVTEGTEVNSSRPLGPVSAGPAYVAVVEIQSAALLQVLSVSPSQDPVTTGQARVWSIDMLVSNSGGSAVTLDLTSVDSTAVAVEGGTGFVFTRPAALLSGGVSLSSGATGTLRFTVSTTGTVPPGDTALSGSVIGTEDNSGTRIYDEISGPVGTNSVVFEERPAPAYTAASLSPRVASTGSDIGIQLGILSADADHATLILDRAQTRAWFGDADGDTFSTDLSDLSGNTLTGGSATTLTFNGATISDDLERTGYLVGVHLEGTENGNPFTADITSAPDTLYIEEAPQLSITSVEIPQSVTAGLQPAWDVRLAIHNSGEASVRLTLAPDSTGISFSIAGVGNRTYEYTVAPPTGLAETGGLILAGGRTDTLVFNVTATGTTTGTAIVNGKVAATDINSGETLADDTYTSGGSFMAVQAPAEPVVLETLAGRSAVTSGQTTPWTVTMLVRNSGEAAMTLQPGSTMIYSGSPLTVPSPPVEFAEGGTTLTGGQERHLAYEVTPTPDIPGGADLRIDAVASFVEDNRGVTLTYDTGIEGSGYGGLRVQAPADIRIISVAGNAPRQPFVNRGQDFPIVLEIANSGEAAAQLVTTGLAGDGSSIILNSPLQADALAGGETLVDTFKVTAADVAGEEVFTSRMISAIDANSGQEDLVILSPGADTTETMMIQDPAAMALTSVLPSQVEVNAGQTADWTIRVDLVNNGGAPASIDAPAPGDIGFLHGGMPLSGYLVVPPSSFGSGLAGWTLGGGGVDSLIYIVSTTGTDTGTVDIGTSLSWTDRNDPGTPASVSSGGSSIYVREPSGLRITSVTSDAPNNALLPNTSIVNTGQVFRVTVTVVNTGGDDLRDIDVSLISNGPASINEISSSPELPNGTGGDFVYEVSSSSTGNEILTAAIEAAYSVNTGQPVSPIQAIESVENIQVQAPAVLTASAYVLSPAGAADDTVSTGQQFQFATSVDNTGGAEIDSYGQVTLSLPAGFTRVYPDTDSLTVSFTDGEEFVWTLQAPASALASPQQIIAAITRVPRDINIDTGAFVQKDADTVSIVTEDAADISGCSLTVSAPVGATDLVLSTGQDLVVTFTAIPSANSRSNTATIILPAGFSTAGGATRQLGDGDGTEKLVEWTVTAPDVEIDGSSIQVSTAGTDRNSGISFSGCTDAITVDVVTRAILSLDAEISGPAEAVGGNLSVDLPFTIEATVSNLAGAAGIDTSGARLEIMLPAGDSYDLNVEDYPGETFRKAFYPGEPVTWNLRAPDSAEPPRIITVRFATPAAKDENSNEAVAYSVSEVPIGVTTEAGTITMQNVSQLDSIPPVVVPRGAADVPVMRVVFRNNSAYTVGMDTLYVSVEDGKGNLMSAPSRYVSAITLSAGGQSWSGPAGSSNPVPVPVDHGFTLPTGASDTALVAIDISAAAPEGALRIDLAGSSDVVFTISSGGTRIGVVHDANGEDIAGFFYNTPLSVMSANFEEYVHNYPNPFRAGSETTKIAYFLTEDTSVSIKIYDYTGVLVWTRDIPAGGPGGSGEPGGIWWQADWDGRNGRGEVVRNGVYMCKVTAGGKSAMFKIAVAK